MAHAQELLPCPTHEGGGVYVNGFPSGPKPYEEVLTFLRKGQIRRVPIAWIKKWQKGQETAVFKKHPQPSASNRSFSIIYTDESKRERTLDVICNTPNEFEMWFWGVQIIRYYPPHSWSAPTPVQLAMHQEHQNYSAVAPSGGRAVPKQPPSLQALDVASIRSSVGESDRPPKPTPKAKAGGRPSQGFFGRMRQSRRDAAALRAENEYAGVVSSSLGEDFSDLESCGFLTTGARDKDNRRIVCVVSRNFQAKVLNLDRVYRSQSNPFSPPTPSLTPGASASPMHRTLGGASGAALNSGGGGGGPQEGSVRSGPRHAPSEMSSSSSDLQGVVAAANAAASQLVGASSHGGDGCAGSVGPPCPPFLGPMRSDMLSSSMNSMEQLARDTPDAASSAPDSGSAGALYTWGGDFSWTEPAEPSKRSEGAGPKRDHHSGCLGLGDKDGRLLPTRVRGDIDKHGVAQVACGWSMTIALSRDGRVYQMGSTGAPKNGEKGCPWEGALSPTRVDGNLFGMFVEE
ncbi:hypothetical protein TSOC_002191, partial [Tetrabaena socialis]